MTGTGRNLLNDADAAAVAEAVRAAEAQTTAEIKVVLARRRWGSLGGKARRVFARLGLHRTAQRNAVLILMLPARREVVIYGDRGIDDGVEQGFWNDVRDSMVACFRDGQVAAGLCEGVRRAGEKLATHFPSSGEDANEITNDVVQGE